MSATRPAVVALGSDDGTEVVLRVVNWAAGRNISLQLLNVQPPAHVTVTVLTSATGGDLDQNTPWDPSFVAPATAVLSYTQTTQFWLPTNSFTVFAFAGIVPAGPDHAL